MIRAGILPRQIFSSLSLKNSELLFYLQNIYNLWWELKAELLEGWSPIEAMFHELERNKYEFNYQLDEDGHITLLLFMHPESLILLK